MKVKRKQQQQQQKTKAERTRENRSYSERARAKWFFKPNLKLALSIILKQRELYESKNVAVECRCLKIWD